MTIAKDAVSKLAVAFVAVAMIFTAFAAPAQAQSTEDLQAQIAELMAQIAALQGGGSTASADTAGVCPYTWTRSLSQGDSGTDVMKLQQLLNTDPDTRVAATGVGSAGMETDYYGPATAAAVSNMQVKYRAEVLSPAGLVNPTGFFGPSSRAKANALCVAAPVVDNGTETETETETGSTGSQTLSGEASLENFEIDSASDDEIEEGKDDQEVAELTFEFEDGDAEISRLDVKIERSGATNEDAFETISLWVDGDKVAEEAADDEDEYQSDEMTMRFSGLDIVAMEDEEVDIVVAVSTQNNLDASEIGQYDISVTSLRFFDADGVATTEDSGEDFGNTENFTIKVEGADDELMVRTNSSDPDATTLPVEDDKKSDEYTVFVFNLDTDDSTNDIELNEIVLNVTTDGNVAAEAGYSDLVDDAELIIDGVTIDDVTVGGTDTTEGTATLTFDVDGDVVIDAGEEVKAELVLTFNSLPSGEEGATIQAAIAGLSTSNVDAEGADDLGNSQLSGSATGEVHTLRTEGVILAIEDITAEEDTKEVGGSDRDFGTFVFKFDVTAFEEDFYTDEDADVIDYRLVVDGSEYTALQTAASSSATLTIRDADDASTADEKLSEGQAVEYTLTVETTTDISGSVEVIVKSVAYSAADDVTEELSQTANPADDWTSNSVILN